MESNPEQAALLHGWSLLQFLPPGLPSIVDPFLPKLVLAMVFTVATENKGEY